MRFFNNTPSLKKFAGIAAALMILPVAVACNSQADDPANTTAEVAEDSADTETPETIVGETIVDVASANGSFDTLVTAIQAAGLAETLTAEGPYTVFAPTDEAFAALPEGILELLLLPENQGALEQILKYHVVEGTVMSTDITPGAVDSVEGEALEISVDGDVMINGTATVSQADVVASNGVIHVIDTVLLPSGVDLAELETGE